MTRTIWRIKLDHLTSKDTEQINSKDILLKGITMLKVAWNLTIWKVSKNWYTEEVRTPSWWTDRSEQQANISLCVSNHPRAWISWGMMAQRYEWAMQELVWGSSPPTIWTLTILETSVPHHKEEWIALRGLLKTSLIHPRTIIINKTADSWSKVRIQETIAQIRHFNQEVIQISINSDWYQ